jgi:hypothetical protein
MKYGRSSQQATLTAKVNQSLTIKRCDVEAAIILGCALPKPLTPGIRAEASFLWLGWRTTAGRSNSGEKSETTSILSGA